MRFEKIFAASHFHLILSDGNLIGIRINDVFQLIQQAVGDIYDWA
jgi:hypothetical protein